jgi:hypothetical protein
MASPSAMFQVLQLRHETNRGARHVRHPGRLWRLVLGSRGDLARGSQAEDCAYLACMKLARGLACFVTASARQGLQTSGARDRQTTCALSRCQASIVTSIPPCKLYHLKLFSTLLDGTTIVINAALRVCISSEFHMLLASGRMSACTLTWSSG